MTGDVGRGRPDRIYTGATKQISLADARTLGSGWAIQPKIDGCYVRLYLDSRGRVARAFSRNEREVPRSELGGILGARIGRPHAELVGELEAHTEAGIRARTERGYPLVHLFDCLHDGTRSLAREPYQVRRDALWRAWAEAEEVAPPRTRNAQGRFSRPGGTAVAPIVPQAPLSALEREWERVKETDAEGLVLVRLDAPAGARCAKAKLKPFETLDVRAVSVSRTTVTCEWRGRLFNLGRGRHYVETGDVVEVRHAGFYESGSTPRFPALVRVRRDLQ